MQEEEGKSPERSERTESQPSSKESSPNRHSISQSPPRHPYISPRLHAQMLQQQQARKVSHNTGSPPPRKQSENDPLKSSMNSSRGEKDWDPQMSSRSNAPPCGKLEGETCENLYCSSHVKDRDNLGPHNDSNYHWDKRRRQEWELAQEDMLEKAYKIKPTVPIWPPPRWQRSG